MTRDEVRGFVGALAGVYPEGQSELDFSDPYTLLVAVVMSAQTTDVAVNKVSAPLFAQAPGPAEMVALGEAGVGAIIRSIGLWQAKAKNVVALSTLLLERHGGVVPNDREALEALPGVGRKTANVVLNVAFGHATMAVDTHVFRLGNRTGRRPFLPSASCPARLHRARQDGAGGGGRVGQADPGGGAAAGASLADPARALRVQGAHARVLAVRGLRVVPVSAEGGGAGG